MTSSITGEVAGQLPTEGVIQYLTWPVEVPLFFKISVIHFDTVVCGVVLPTMEPLITSDVQLKLVAVLLKKVG